MCSCEFGKCNCKLIQQGLMALEEIASELPNTHLALTALKLHDELIKEEDKLALEMANLCM